MLTTNTNNCFRILSNLPNIMFIVNTIGNEWLYVPSGDEEDRDVSKCAMCINCVPWMYFNKACGYFFWYSLLTIAEINVNYNCNLQHRRAYFR